MDNPVSALMLPNSIIVGVDDSIEKVERIFRIHKHGYATVIDDQNLFHGLITADNLLRFQMAWKTIGALRASDICTQNVIAVNPVTSIRQAAELMLRKQSEFIVVMEGDDVLGVVTSLHLLKAVLLELEPGHAGCLDRKGYFASP